MRAFYFGCARGIDGRTQAGGHYFYSPAEDGGLREERPRVVPQNANPWGVPDGSLAPRPAGRWSEAPQGVAALHHKDGWTAISFWDRSGDSRGNSNSTFMFDQELSFDHAVAAARKLFPKLFERFGFEVRE